MDGCLLLILLSQELHQEGLHPKDRLQNKEIQQKIYQGEVKLKDSNQYNKIDITLIWIIYQKESAGFGNLKELIIVLVRMRSKLYKI